MTSSGQLLRSLLGDDALCVDVRTADSLVGSVLGKAGMNKDRPNASKREAIRTAALEAVARIGNAIQQGAQARTVERLGRRYLFEEIETVIQARGLSTLDEYLQAPRPGRRVPLNATQRQAVWVVAEGIRVRPRRGRHADLGTSPRSCRHARCRRRTRRAHLRRRHR